MKDWLYALMISCLAVLAPIKPLITAVTFLIGADTATGIWAAKKRKEKISSAKLRSIISKTIIYQVCIIAAYVTEFYILGGDLPVAKMVAGAIATVELKSLLENANSITGKDLFQEIKSKLGSPNLKPEEVKEEKDGQ